jgi:hypothetical protein
MGYFNNAAIENNTRYKHIECNTFTDGMPERFRIEQTGNVFSIGIYVYLEKWDITAWRSFHNGMDTVSFTSYEEAFDFVQGFAGFLQWMSGIAASTPDQDQKPVETHRVIVVDQHIVAQYQDMNGVWYTCDKGLKHPKNDASDLAVYSDTPANRRKVRSIVGENAPFIVSRGYTGPVGNEWCINIDRFESRYNTRTEAVAAIARSSQVR